MLLSGMGSASAPTNSPENEITNIQYCVMVKFSNICEYTQFVCRPINLSTFERGNIKKLSVCVSQFEFERNMIIHITSIRKRRVLKRV